MKGSIRLSYVLHWLITMSNSSVGLAWAILATLRPIWRKLSLLIRWQSCRATRSSVALTVTISGRAVIGRPNVRTAEPYVTSAHSP